MATALLTVDPLVRACLVLAVPLPVPSCILSALLAWVIDVPVRQLLHLLLGNIEMNAARKSGHPIGGDSHFLVTPQTPLFEKYVYAGHLVRAGVDAERTELPDLAVGGMDLITMVFLLPFLPSTARRLGTRSISPVSISARTGEILLPSTTGLSPPAGRQPSVTSSTGPEPKTSARVSSAAVRSLNCASL